MTTIEADYLVVGAGAMGMAFVDTILTETEATVVLVDDGPAPGGHWTSSYPFVRLHQPSAYYGVNSRELGSGIIDQHGWNEGFYELAAGSEVCAYYDQLLRQQLLPTGRLTYRPMSHYLGDNVFRTLGGDDVSVEVRHRTVDATYLLTTVPAMRPPPFFVADGVAVVDPTALPRNAAGHDHFTVVGAGKTGMDACLWLLRNGVPHDRLRWIMPRDSWMMNRANVQPGPLFLDRLRSSIGSRMHDVMAATSFGDLFARLESDHSLLRLDGAVEPSMYHCAIVSFGELEQLRQITDVVRRGRVVGVERDRLVLQEETIPAPPSLYVDCTTPGLTRPPSVPVFGGEGITLQSVRGCQQVFSAALIAHVEATYSDDHVRNHLCAPVQHPDTPLDWLRIMLADNVAQARWLRDADLTAWLESSRLNVVSGLFSGLPDEPQAREQAVDAVTAAMDATNERLEQLITTG